MNHPFSMFSCTRCKRALAVPNQVTDWAFNVIFHEVTSALEYMTQSPSDVPSTPLVQASLLVPIFPISVTYQHTQHDSLLIWSRIRTLINLSSILSALPLYLPRGILRVIFAVTFWFAFYYCEAGPTIGRQVLPTVGRQALGLPVRNAMKAGD